MNRQWSELNRKMQEQIKRKDTFREGIMTLLELRSELRSAAYALREGLRRQDFDAMPFANREGLENKSIAYSLYHMLRIEDIVCNTLIRNQEEVFFANGYCEKLGASLVTTGNELVKEEIAAFSEGLDLDALYSYLDEVYACTNSLLQNLTFERTKAKMSENDRLRLVAKGVVSPNERAAWLVDYWCGKNIGGLIRMPFSRHWIMHIEASQRIGNRLRR